MTPFVVHHKSNIKGRTLTDHLFSDIIHRCKRGERQAQEAVYNMLSAKMFAVCMRYCRNRDEAADVLHDGFVTVFTKIGQFRNEGSFEGWVRRIFVNHAVERFRNTAKFVLLDNIEDVGYMLAAPEPEAEWTAYQLSEAELLGLINALPQQYKVVFNMYVLEGLSHKEISGMLGISESTSRSNLLRARGILQKQVNEWIKKIPYKQQYK
ncbi:MAG: RNA polymerase sigma factor [Bacteroidales bacterium]|nr:RNA polymerase sigma factor [Bacteroidales bacterium]